MFKSKVKRTVQVADTEESVILPAGTFRFKVTKRTYVERSMSVWPAAMETQPSYPLHIAIVSGVVVSGEESIIVGDTYESGELDEPPARLYFSSPHSGIAFTVESWFRKSADDFPNLWDWVEGPGHDWVGGTPAAWA